MILKPFTKPDYKYITKRLDEIHEKLLQRAELLRGELESREMTETQKQLTTDSLVEIENLFQQIEEWTQDLKLNYRP